MTRLQILIVLIFQSLFSLAQDQNYQFSILAGTNVRDLEVDTLGNVYAVGRGDIVPSCIDFDVTESRGSAFIAKFDIAGNVVWRLNFGGANAQAEGLAIDPRGDLIVTGSFRDNGDFSSTIIPSMTFSANKTDVFVMKISQEGEVIWVKSAGGQSDDEGFDVDTDSNGKIFVTGTFNFWVKFGNIELKGTDFNHDPFIWTLNSEGNTLWAIQVPSGVLGEGEHIMIDDDGNVVNVGRIYDLESKKRLIYLSKYSPNGAELFFKKFVVSNQSYNFGLETDAQNNIYLTGYIADSIDFDPGLEKNILYGSAPLRGDAYLLKLNKFGEFIWVNKTGDERGFINGTGLKIDDNGYIYISGIFKNTVDFDPGIGTFEMSTNPQYSKTYIQILDSTGTFVHALNQGFLNGSQSYNTFAFTIGQNRKMYLGREHPQGFVRGYIDVYGECPVEVQNQKITSCRNFELNGNTITTNCNYRTFSGDSISGCGIISDLNIEIIPQIEVKVDQTDSTLILRTNTDNTTWLDCDADFEPILNENNPIFKPKQSGNYACEVIFNGCRDTSDCYYVDIMTSTDLILDKQVDIHIFPNPFLENVHINHLPSNFAEIVIYNLNGIKMFEIEKVKGNTTMEIPTNNFPNGMYIIVVRSEVGILTKLLSKI